MVNWKDPEVIAYDFFLYEQIAVFLLGFYGCVSPVSRASPLLLPLPLPPPFARARARLRFELEFGLECECESRPAALAEVAC